MRFGKHRDLVGPNWHIHFAQSMAFEVDPYPELRDRDT